MSKKRKSGNIKPEDEEGYKHKWLTATEDKAKRSRSVYDLVDMLATKTHELIKTVDDMKSELQVLTNINEGFLYPKSHDSTDSLRRASKLNSFNQFLNKVNEEDSIRRTRHGEMVVVALSDNPEHIGKKSQIYKIRREDKKRLLIIDGKEFYYDNKNLIFVAIDSSVVEKPHFPFYEGMFVRIIKTSNAEHKMKVRRILQVKPNMGLCLLKFKDSVTKNFNSVWYPGTFLTPMKTVDEEDYESDVSIGKSIL